ncbi:NADH-quinone oxidoreductase subunit L [Solitalea koreensis]|uniref:NADH dehydrogenase subunit L n=1 Tax=Solitalea koreensis TaxID=543615 RepID=A0A521ALH0_9SPHI|nr:NADH-quinone oxidoreductase subunit L [Solitalea koreensis]SMO35633.1 NADH dehydrogenase subunit L [Solitalea koreensis]
MQHLLWLIPTLPLAGFLILALGRYLSRTTVALVGVGSVSLSALITIIIGVNFISNPPPSGAYSQFLWTWFNASGFAPKISLYLDSLSLVFVFVITFVSALIHLYSSEFMIEDKSYARFFAYMNLFVFSMLILVLAEDLLLMYLGWEGVGLCSFLLIGFWYEKQENGLAAQKAFIITRIGDTAMAIGLFILFYQFQTLHIPALLQGASNKWQIGAPIACTVALLLLAGGIGKSAQLPLQTWLPDAMAGPSPVSALIHAATMVTAGVYLIARMHVIFERSPFTQHLVAVIGAVTLLLAGCSALAQFDIKRVLAYSTISQIGYMFLALGVGAWSAAIFHFMIHAFFKALLFLAAGAVIETQHHEHNMFKMGGLKDKMPLIFWTFLAGAMSLAALPLVSAGFYSKDQILWYAWSAEKGTAWLWLAALIGALITAAYTTRMIILTFFGESKTPLGHLPGMRITIPLVILAVLSITAGFIELPHNFGQVTIFSDLVQKTLPETRMQAGVESEFAFQLIAAIIGLSGIYLTWWTYAKNPGIIDKLKSQALPSTLHRLWFSGWFFDTIYNALFVKPFKTITSINKNDFIDQIYTALVQFTNTLNRILSLSQSGSLRWYIMGIIMGSIIILTLNILL